MSEDALKKAMLKYAPQLANDYKKYVKKQFGLMQKDLGKSLKGVYNSPRWARTWGSIRSNIRRQGNPPVLSSREADTIPYIIHTESLNRNAKMYGEAVALDWYNKMLGKLGPLSSVTVKLLSDGDVVITGKLKEHNVRIDQQRIINISSRGLMFHQFPARIYVDGKFKSEVAYKNELRKMNLKVPERIVKPKREKIDPMSRPRSFRFNYLADYWPNPQFTDAHNKSNLGVKGEDSIKGMTEKEAWQKLVKSKTGPWPNKFFSRIYNPELIAISAWNGEPLWKKGQKK